jgi:hypothetical protein
MKAIWMILICMSVVATAQAQPEKKVDYYRTAVGLKYQPYAITAKQAIFKHHLVEALMYFYKGARITGLYEFHRKFKNSNSFRWYFGPGVHIQFNDDKTVNSGKNFVGFDGVFGIDWKLKKLPINISADWQPSFDFVDVGDNFKGGFGGISVRYVLN